MEDDFTEPGQLRRKFLPQPAGHEFDGGVFQPGNVVEVGVVELLDDGPHGVGNDRVVVEDSGGLIDGTADGDGDLEAVAVDLAALVALGKLGQGLGRFELEIFAEGDDHDAVGQPSSTGAALSSGRFRLALRNPSAVARLSQ
jgi:hypothetical protein